MRSCRALAQRAWRHQSLLHARRTAHDGEVASNPLQSEPAGLQVLAGDVQEVAEELLRQGSASSLVGHFLEAERYFEAAVDGTSSYSGNKSATRALAFQQLSAALLARGALEHGAAELSQRAHAAAENALAICPANEKTLFCRAVALSRLGKVQAAAEDLRRLLLQNGSRSGLDAGAEVQAWALLARCCMLGGGPYVEVMGASRAGRRVLGGLVVADEAAVCAAPLGALGLELELLACAAAVEVFSEVEPAAQVLHELRQEDHQQCKVNFAGEPLPSMDMAHFLLQEPQTWELDLDAMVPDQQALVGRLTWIAFHADRVDLHELLWQSLAWRCRAHLLACNWPNAISDATKALALNVFAAAELLKAPSLPVTPTEALEPPASLSSSWSCLRMRAVALENAGWREAARADRLLLQCLATPPPALDSQTLSSQTLSSQELAVWSNFRRTEDGWRRTLEQRAALRRRRDFRRDGVFDLPRSIA